jgi:hypothetical protein
MRRAIPLILLLAACSGDDTDARQDLPASNQMYDVSAATVVVNPDGFPNVSHKCVKSTGFWTTTDRTLILIYNDWLCPGANLEKDMVVINGVPRAIVNAGP